MFLWKSWTGITGSPVGKTSWAVDSMDEIAVRKMTMHKRKSAAMCYIIRFSDIGVPDYLVYVYLKSNLVLKI